MCFSGLANNDQDLNMQAVIFTGIQGSGKSYFYRKFFFHTHMRINLDMLRTRNREQHFLQTCIQTRTRFVVDNTNSTIDQRRVYIEAAKKAGYEVVGYFFDVAFEVAMQQNRSRKHTRVVPRAGVCATARKLQIPSAKEGFDKLYRVEMPLNGRYIISDIPILDTETEEPGR